MAARASVFRRTQIGVEVTPGTAVSADIQLAKADIQIRPQSKVQQFRPAGGRFHTNVTRAKEHCNLEVGSEVICYRDLLYLLGASLKSSGGATEVTYLPGAFADETLDTLTVESGDSGRAERAAYGVITGLSFQFPQQGIPSVSGSGFARAHEEGHTMTSSPVKNPDFPVNEKDVTVLIGNSVGGLAQIPKPLMTQFSFEGMYKPAFYLDAAASFTEHVPLAPNVSAEVSVEYGSTAAGWMADLRASTQRFMRILASDGTRSLRITFPFRFLEPQPGDQEDLVANTFRLGPDYEANFGGAFEIYVKS